MAHKGTFGWSDPERGPIDTSPLDLVSMVPALHTRLLERGQL